MTTINKEENEMNVAETIIKQMGGSGRLVAMTGAYGFRSLEGKGVAFRFKGSRKANVCSVVLDPDDTYTVTFHRLCKQRGMLQCKEIKSLSGVYCEMLIEIFESTTGLYLSL